MSKHVSYRGVTIDMDSIRRENEKIPAIGNMNVNARGDEISGGKVTRTADEIAREKGRVQSLILNTGLKGPVPTPVDTLSEVTKQVETQKQSRQSQKKSKEVELPSGDIVVEGNEDEN